MMMNVTLLLLVTNVVAMRKNNGEYVQTQWDPIHVTVMMDSEVQIRPTMTASVSIIKLVLYADANLCRKIVIP